MTAKGTPLYVPPQVFENSRYSSKFDIWSIGAILHELIFDGLQLNAGVKNLGELKRRLFSHKVLLLNHKTKGNQYKFPPSSRNVKLIEIMKSMLKFSEEDRIDWNQIFQSDWFHQSPETFLGLNPTIPKTNLKLTPKEADAILIKMNTFY